MRIPHVPLLVIATLLLVACGAVPEQAQNNAPLSWPDSVVAAQHMRSDTSAHVQLRFHWEASPFLDAHIGGLQAEALASLRHDLDMLDLAALSTPVDILYFDAREDLRPLTGVAPKGIALQDRNTLLIATNDSMRAYHTHELMHLVSIGAWRGATAPADWIQEGLAVLADAPCQQYELQTIAAYHLHKGTLIPLDSLTQQFRSLPDMASYMQAGAFVGYLIDRFGMARFEQLWKRGWADVRAVTDSDAPQLEADYRAWLLARYPACPDVDWALLEKKGCG